MKTYMVPPDVNEKEKVIGGMFDIGQFFWLIGGLVVGIAVFIVLFPLLGKFSLMPGLIFSLSGVPFIIIKPKELSLFEYLKRKRQFKAKTKHLPHSKTNFDW